MIKRKSEQVALLIGFVMVMLVWAGIFLILIETGGTDNPVLPTLMDSTGPVEVAAAGNVSDKETGPEEGSVASVPDAAIAPPANEMDVEIVEEVVITEPDSPTVIVDGTTVFTWGADENDIETDSNDILNETNTESTTPDDGSDTTVSDDSDNETSVGDSGVDDTPVGDADMSDEATAEETIPDDVDNDTVTDPDPNDSNNDIIGDVSSDDDVIAQEPVIVKISSDLLDLQQTVDLAAFKTQMPIMPIVNNAVIIDAIAAGDTNRLLADLQALGLRNGTAFGRMVSGELPISALGSLSALDSLLFARPAYAGVSVGAVDSQGDAAMRSDDVRTMFGINGNGILVGVLSDSYDCLGGAAGDVGTGDLPAGINVLDEGPCPATDEGRGMMQLIFDVAPGSTLAFHTAFQGQADFAQGILDLQAAGADIIVDDVFYFAQPFFQDGVVAQAADTVVAAGIPYFSAAGNDARQSYQDAFRDSGNDLIIGMSNLGNLHDFDPGPGVDTTQNVTIGIAPPGSNGVIISFQWDEPFASVSGAPGSASNLDIYLLDTGGNVVASGTTNNVGNDAVEVVNFVNNTGGTNFNISLVHVSGPVPNIIKYIHFGGVTINQFDTQSPTVFGHPNSANSMGVGAAFFGQTPEFGVNPPLLENFSSWGGIPIIFDTAGARLGTPVIRNKPQIVAPDGTNTTFFGGDIGFDADAFPNFFGTSAAAPHAAAVGALLLEEDGTLTPNAMFTLMQNTAIDMNTPGFDFATGFGLIDARHAMSDLVNESDLSITKTDSVEPAIAGGQLTYTLSVTNNGPSDAEGVVVTDTLPTEVTFASASVGCVEAPTGTVTCTVGDLDNGDTVDFSITVDIPPDVPHMTIISNTATVTTTRNDPDVTDNTDIEDTTVIAVADLEVVSMEVLNPPTEILAGEDVLITVRTVIDNNGPSGPIDTVLDQTASASANGAVTPTDTSSPQAALGIDEMRVVDTVFTISCSKGLPKTFTFNSEITAFDPTISDPDPTNNTGEEVLVVECVIPVDVDIRPHNPQNPVNLGSNGVLQVAIMSNTEFDFDARLVDPSTVLLSGASVRLFNDPERIQTRDVNHDGLLDAVVRIEVSEIDANLFDIIMGTKIATLTGQTFPVSVPGDPQPPGPIHFKGEDFVWTVPPENASSSTIPIAPAPLTVEATEEAPPPPAPEIAPPPVESVTTDESAAPPQPETPPDTGDGAAESSPPAEATPPDVEATPEVTNP